VKNGGWPGERSSLNAARSARPAGALKQRTVVRTSVGGGMQLQYTDAAHVDVIASWNLSALLTALQSEQSAKRRVRSSDHQRQHASIANNSARSAAN